MKNRGEIEIKANVWKNKCPSKRIVSKLPSLKIAHNGGVNPRPHTQWRPSGVKPEWEWKHFRPSGAFVRIQHFHCRSVHRRVTRTFSERNILESCCWVVTWASRRTHWWMSPAAPPGRFVLRNHSSIWVMSSKREPFKRGGHRWTWQRLTPASVCSASAPECSDSCTKGPWHVQHESQTRWCNTNAVLIYSPSEFLTPSPRSAAGSRVI